MRVAISWLGRQIAFGLVMLLIALLLTTRGIAQTAATPLPPAPGPVGTAAIQDQTSQDQTVNQTPAPTQPAPAASSPASTPAPVGAAAAPYVRPGGVAASRPAGAAIAPAKQKRIRSIAIKVGLLVAAGVAVGIVVAASQGSPSRPH